MDTTKGQQQPHQKNDCVNRLGHECIVFRTANMSGMLLLNAKNQSYSLSNTLAEMR